MIERWRRGQRCAGAWRGLTLGLRDLGGVALTLGCLALPAAASGRPASPQAAVDELLAADRAFSAGGAGLDAVTALARTFADDVVLPTPAGLARGVAAATEALRGNPDNLTSTLGWEPLRGGVSADGQQGFTFGLMEQRKGDGTVVGLKYLAYWRQSEEGWRMVTLRRRPRAAGEVSRELRPASLPSTWVAPQADGALLARHAESLKAAEQTFSDEAQQIGLGPAFAKFGAPDAVNLGGPGDADFVSGPAAIAAAVTGGEPTSTSCPVTWSAEEVRVASSGDLGVTFGIIRAKEAAAPGQPPAAFPFFTIWRRASLEEPWRYVAE
jgi:ketosteroid isomerase-like protein